MKSKLIYLLPFIILGSLVFIFLIKFERMKKNISDNFIQSPLVGETIPDINIVKLKKNNTLDFYKYKNKKFIINFFASWCQPCKVEAPLLKKLSSNIDIIGIAYKDKELQILDFLKDYGNPYNEIGIDETGAIAIEWGVYGVPETFIINDRKIIFKHTGPITYDDLKNTILPLINNQ